ncbi:MAG: hypothetical protein OEZ00_08495, partial [Dehalococcoidia bacterium]|nr:hypothetical protein [Dehalococcoidia bacterium]
KDYTLAKGLKQVVGKGTFAGADIAYNEVRAIGLNNLCVRAHLSIILPPFYSRIKKRFRREAHCVLEFNGVGGELWI